VNYNNIKTYLDWNYKSKDLYSSGYEEYYPFFNQYKKEKFLNLLNEDQLKAIDDNYNVYRSVNIFPIFYYTENGILEEIKKCYNRDVEFSGNTLDLKYKQGNTLLKFLFPNFHRSSYGHRENPINSFDKFYKNGWLKEIIAFQLKYDSAIPLRLLSTMNLYRQRTPNNFNPMKAKALYERYCPKDGIIYDFSCGYGGRMLGALTSKNNYKYIGVEPNSETFDNLLILGNFIEISLQKLNTFDIYKDVSENYIAEKNSIDFAFSSPPYFDLEKYSDEDTQCYIRYPEINEWFENYVTPTINNIHYGLKDDAYYAVNIADFNVPGIGRINLVDRWTEISERIGFDLVDHLYMKLSNRGGRRRSGKTGGFNKKEESIYVFKKVDKHNSNNYKNRNIPKYIEDKVKIYNDCIQTANDMENDIIEWYIKYSNNLNLDKSIITQILKTTSEYNNLEEAIHKLNKLLKE